MTIIRNEPGYHWDLGTYKTSVKDIEGENMVSHEATILNDIREKIGSGQVTASDIDFAPSLIIE